MRYGTGFGEVGEDGVFTDALGNTYDLVETFPTVEDYAANIFGAYEYDLTAAFPTESADGTDVLPLVNSDFIGYWGPLDEAMGGAGVPNIAGIVKVDDYTVEVTVNGYSAPAVYSILGIQVTRCTITVMRPNTIMRTTCSVLTMATCPNSKA